MKRFEEITKVLLRPSPGDRRIDRNLVDLHEYLTDGYTFDLNVVVTCIIRVVSTIEITPQRNYVLRQILKLSILTETNFFLFLTLVYAHFKKSQIHQFTAVLEFLDRLLKDDKIILNFFRKYSGLNFFFDVYRQRLLEYSGQKFHWSEVSHANRFEPDRMSSYIYNKKSNPKKKGKEEVVKTPTYIRNRGRIIAIPRLKLVESIKMRVREDDLIHSRSSRRNLRNDSPKEKILKSVSSSDLFKRMWFMKSDIPSENEFVKFSKTIGEFYFFSQVNHFLKVKREVRFVLKKMEDEDEESDKVLFTRTFKKKKGLKKIESLDKKIEEEEEDDDDDDEDDDDDDDDDDIEIDGEANGKNGMRSVSSSDSLNIITVSPSEETIEILQEQRNMDDKVEGHLRFVRRRRLNSIKTQNRDEAKKSKIVILRIMKTFAKHVLSRQNSHNLVNFLMNELNSERDCPVIVTGILEIMVLYTRDFLHSNLGGGMLDNLRRPPMVRSNISVKPKSNLFFWRWNGITSKMINTGNSFPQSQVSILSQYLNLCEKKLDEKTFSHVCSQCANCNVNLLVELNERFRRNSDTLGHILDVFRIMIFHTDDDSFRRNVLKFSQNQIIYLQTRLTNWIDRTETELTSIILFYCAVLKLYEYFGISPQDELDILLDDKTGVVLGILKSDQSRFDSKVRLASLKLLRNFLKLPTERLKYYFGKPEFMNTYLSILYSKFLHLYISSTYNKQSVEYLVHYVKALVAMVRHRSVKEVGKIVFNCQLVEFLISEMSLECDFYLKFKNRTIRKSITYKTLLEADYNSPMGNDFDDDNVSKGSSGGTSGGRNEDLSSIDSGRNVREGDSLSNSPYTLDTMTDCTDTYTMTYDDMTDRPEGFDLNEEFGMLKNPGSLIPRLNIIGLKEDGNKTRNSLETPGSPGGGDSSCLTDLSCLSEYQEMPSPKVPKGVPKLCLFGTANNKKKNSRMESSGVSRGSMEKLNELDKKKNNSDDEYDDDDDDCDDCDEEGDETESENENNEYFRNNNKNNSSILNMKENYLKRSARIRLKSGLRKYIKREDGNEMKNFEVARENRMIYQDPDLHKNMLYLLLLCLIDENHVLNSRYLDRLPEQNDMTNILFILHHHINNFNNQKVATDVYSKIMRINVKAIIAKSRFRNQLNLRKRKQEEQEETEGEEEDEDNDSGSVGTNINNDMTSDEEDLMAYYQRLKSEHLSLKVLFRLLSKKLYNSNRYKITKRIGYGAYGQIFEAVVSGVYDDNNGNNNDDLGNNNNSSNSSINNNNNNSSSGNKNMKKSDRLLAVKIIPIEVDISDFQAIHSIFHECLIMERLHKDPSICEIVDYGVDNESYYIVMKRYKCNLKHWRSKNILRLSLPIFVNIFYQILKAVKNLHDEGIAHFDLKCENVYLDYDETQDPHFLSNYKKVNRKVCVSPSGSVNPASHMLKNMKKNRGDDDGKDVNSSNNNNSDREDNLISKSGVQNPKNMNKKKKEFEYQQQVDYYFYNQQQMKPTLKIVLGDFGESFIFGKGEGSSNCTKFRGTQIVCSPEMIQIEMIKKTMKNYDRRKKVGAGKPSDVWSLGCLFYELLGNEFLFDGGDFVIFFTRLMNSEIDLVSKEKWRVIGCDHFVYDFLKFMLVREPYFRPGIDSVIQECKNLIKLYPSTLEKYRMLVGGLTPRSDSDSDDNDNDDSDSDNRESDPVVNRIPSGLKIVNKNIEKLKKGGMRKKKSLPPKNSTVTV